MAALRGPGPLREVLSGLLSGHGGNVSAVARGLGTSRTQIHRWLRRAERDPTAFR